MHAHWSIGACGVYIRCTGICTRHPCQENCVTTTCSMLSVGVQTSRLNYMCVCVCVCIALGRSARYTFNSGKHIAAWRKYLALLNLMLICICVCVCVYIYIHTYTWRGVFRHARKTVRQLCRPTARRTCWRRSGQQTRRPCGSSCQLIRSESPPYLVDMHFRRRGT